MACDSQTLVADGACFGCLDAKSSEMAKLALLCQILQALVPMATCSPTELVQDGACFGCLDGRSARIAELQLLCEIKDAMTGGGGSGALVCMDADPVAAPTGNCQFVYVRVVAHLWAWDSTLGVWVQLIV